MMTMELMSSAYPCVPVNMKRADVSHSPWKKMHLFPCKKVQGKMWKTFLWNKHLEREFQFSVSTSLFTYAAERKEERDIPTHKFICTTKWRKTHTRTLFSSYYICWVKSIVLLWYVLEFCLRFSSWSQLKGRKKPNPT